jgi:hypothetical protein
MGLYFARLPGLSQTGHRTGAERLTEAHQPTTLKAFFYLGGIGEWTP